MAAGVDKFESLVEGIREQIHAEEAELAHGVMLDLAQAEGAILLSYLHSQGLLVRVGRYTCTSIRANMRLSRTATIR